MAGTLQVLLLVAWMVGLSAADSAFSEKLYLDAKRAIFQGRTPGTETPENELLITPENGLLIKVKLERSKKNEIFVDLKSLNCPHQPTVPVIQGPVHKYCFHNSFFTVHTVNGNPVIQISAYFLSDNPLGDSGLQFMSLIFSSASPENQQVANKIAVTVPQLFATRNPGTISENVHVEYDLTWVAEILKKPLKILHRHNDLIDWLQGAPIILDEGTFQALLRRIQEKTA